MAGLAGIIAGDSAISTVGIGMGLNYRGYDIKDLSKYCIFEEVAYLLYFGALPTQAQLNWFRAEVAKSRWLPKVLKEVLERIPKNVHPMDVMRTISSFMGLLEPEDKKNNQTRIAIRLLGMFPTALLYWYHFVHSGKRIEVETDPNDTVAANFMKLML